MKKISIILVIILVFVMVVLGILNLRDFSKKEAYRQYNINCFVGCKNETKCPDYKKYTTYSQFDRDRLMKDLGINDADILEREKNCSNVK